MNMYSSYVATNVLCLKELLEKVPERYKYLHIWSSQKSLFDHHKNQAETLSPYIQKE